MLTIEILAVGKVKSGPFLDLWKEYARRISWSVTLTEITGHDTADEHQNILQKLDTDSFVIALDEKGRAVKSVNFAHYLNNLAVKGRNKITFVIGGTNGLGPEIKDRADLLVSFGKQTWPHKLVRVMLAEQIYRAEQILAGHPYHRE